MAQIITRPTATGAENNLLFSSNDEVGRLLSVGSDWKKLRVMFRGSIGVLGTEVPNSTTITPRLFLGLCSGTTNMVKSNSTTNFIGWASVAASFIYYNGSGSPIWVQSGGSPFALYRAVNGVSGSLPTNVAGTAYISATGSVATAFGFEIWKDTVSGVATQYSMSWISQTSLSNPPTTINDSYNYADYGWSFASSGWGVATLNESSGSLNAINIHWKESGGRKFEIADIVVGRLA